MTSKRHFEPNLKGAACFALVLVALVLGPGDALDTYWLKHRGEVVTATVLQENHSRRSSSIDVRYQTKTGETIEYTTNKYAKGAAGQQIQIVYDPRSPHRMQAVEYGFSYWPLTLWLAFAIACAWTGALQLWRKSPSKDAKPTA